MILLIATNAALIGLSRLTYSMGQHRQLPEILRQVHPKFKTPYVAIIVFSVVAALVMAPGETSFLGTIYAFGATLSFTVAHVSVIRLRKLRPLAERPTGKDGERPWRPRGNVRIRGVDVPLTAVLGGLGTFGAFVVAMALNPIVLATGGGWMIVGTLLYVAYRRHQGLPLTKTVKVETLTPLGVEEVEYKSVLVAFDEDDPFSEEAVATAKALAAAAGARSTCSRWSACPPTCRSTRSSTAASGGPDEDRAGEADLRPAGHRTASSGCGSGGSGRRSSTRPASSRRRRSSCRSATATARRCTARRCRPCSRSVPAG